MRRAHAHEVAVASALALQAPGRLQSRPRRPVTSKEADKLCHVLRASWRARMWQRFMDSDRHECADWAQLPSQALWTRFRAVDSDATRRWMHSSPEARSVALMGVVSPAWGRVGPLTCPWHCGCLGHWKHVVFECPSRPAPHCSEPPCPWAGRCGWVLRPANLTSLRGAHRAQERALQAIWSERWGRSS